MNVESGLRKAWAFGVIGFAITATLMSVLAAAYFVLVEIHPMDREKDLERLPGMILTPSFGIAALFWLAGLASSASKQSPTFYRAFIWISSPALIVLLMLPIQIRAAVGIPQRLLFAAAPFVAAVLMTVFLLNHGADLKVKMRRNADVDPDASAEA